MASFSLVQYNHPLLSLCLTLTAASRAGEAAALAQLLSHVRLSATPWTISHQASLSFTISQSLLKLMSTESVMPSSHLILCHPSPSPPTLNLSQHQGLFQRVDSLQQMAKALEFQLQRQSCQ